jgi:hypothetical protein
VKKLLPFILLGLGISVLLAVYFLVVKKPTTPPPAESSTLIEVALNDRPFTSLTPSADGHWLKLRVEKLITQAASMDYELLYELPDGRSQGVPGNIKLEGQNMIERDLLLGSESSGKFRYDEGVKQGTLTLKFRDNKGKLLVKFMTKFALLSKTKEITSVDEKFTYSLSKSPTKNYFVVMETFGIPTSVSAGVVAGPYGVFTSAAALPAGSAGEGWKAIGEDIFIQ